MPKVGTDSSSNKMLTHPNPIWWEFGFIDYHNKTKDLESNSLRRTFHIWWRRKKVYFRTVFVRFLVNQIHFNKKKSISIFVNEKLMATLWIQHQVALNLSWFLSFKKLNLFENVLHILKHSLQCLSLTKNYLIYIQNLTQSFFELHRILQKKQALYFSYIFKNKIFKFKVLIT